MGKANGVPCVPKTGDASSPRSDVVNPEEARVIEIIARLMIDDELTIADTVDELS